MNHPESRKTTLELVLLVWTALNAVIGFYNLLTAKIQFFGSGFVVFVPFVIGLLAAALLIWRLFRPTRTVLLFGALYWGLQVISVQLPDALYAFRLGLSISFRITSNPNYIVTLNIIALIVAGLFLTAAMERSAPGPGLSEPGSNT